ncbi:aromatic acid exporter family protein [Micromonospora sp. NPDC050417]|uniref:aromatic acid exporter family protein n=1 Tax=Micromonospora sp. NPDC050417 TaxID=3364280 RepID=UPI003787C987
MFSFRHPGRRRPPGLPADPATRRVDEILARWADASRTKVRDRVRQIEINLMIAVQAGVAAALSWGIAHEVLNTPQPVFAPAAAVGTIASSTGQRLHRTVALIAGVAVGIGVGDGLMLIAGRGPWQLGVIVTLAVIGAILISGRGVLLAQAGGTAVLIAALSPTVGELEYPRFVDALIGGGVGLVVVLLLLPFNPRRIVQRAASYPIEELARQLSLTAQAMRARDPAAIGRAVDGFGAIESDLVNLKAAVEGAKEVVQFAPARWHRRQTLALFTQGAEHMDNAVWSSRGLARRAVSLVADGEPLPDCLPVAVDRLADAVRLLHDEFRHGRVPDEARRRVLRAVHDASQGYDHGVALSGAAVVAQVRSAATDLLQATGVDREDANKLVREAARTTATPT